MNLEFLEKLEKHFDNIYVRVDNCNEKQDSVAKKLANDDKRIDLLIQEQQHNNRNQKINNWLTAAVASGIIALVVEAFFGG